MMIDEDDAIRRGDENYWDWLRLIALACDDGEVRERGGVLVTCIGTPPAWFNIVFITQPLADPARQIADGVRYFDERGLDCIVRMREGVDPASEAACVALGMPYSDTVPGMILSDMTDRGNTVAGLEIRTCATDAESGEHIATSARIFGMERSMVERVMGLRYQRQPDMATYNGYVDGRCVATSGLYATHRVAGVYNVTCDPEYRGRGIGEAMTWHAVNEGAKIGCLIASLQASEMGAPVYARMGFRALAPYRTFHRPGV